MKAIPISEQETIINLSRDDMTAKVYTTDSTMITKLDKMVKKQPDKYKIVKQDEYGKWYTCPKKLIGFRCAAAHKTISDEERAKRSEHMRAMNKQRGESNA